MLELPETSLSGQLVQAGVKLAPGYVTRMLGLEPGARAFLRQLPLGDGEGPVELASMWLPIELASGTGLASPDLLDDSIRHHPQARKKIRFDHAVERISARRPTGEDAGLPQVPADAPVLNVIVAAYDVTARPLQVVDIVLPGDRHEIHDAYRSPDPPLRCRATAKNFTR